MALIPASVRHCCSGRSKSGRDLPRLSKKPERCLNDADIERDRAEAIECDEIAGEESRDTHGQITGKFIEPNRKAPPLGPDKIDFHDHGHGPGVARRSGPDPWPRARGRTETARRLPPQARRGPVRAFAPRDRTSRRRRGWTTFSGRRRTQGCRRPRSRRGGRRRRARRTTPRSLIIGK
jgi:hypothetical protein